MSRKAEKRISLDNKSELPPQGDISESHHLKGDFETEIEVADFGFEKSKKIIEAESQNPHIAEISISITDSIFSFPGMGHDQVLQALRTFCAWLKNFRKIKMLCIEFNRPPQEHEAIVVALFEGLKGNIHLQRLMMKGLTLPSARSVEVFESALQSFPSLDTLRTDVPLSEDNIKKIIRAFTYPFPSGTIDLSGCTLTDRIVIFSSVIEELSLTCGNQQLSPTMKNLYDEQTHRQRWRKLPNHAQFSLHQGSHKIMWVCENQLRYVYNYLSTRPGTELNSNHQLKFTPKMTGNLALSQLAKTGESNIWQELDRIPSTRYLTPFWCSFLHQNNLVGEIAPYPMHKAAAQRFLESKYGELASTYLIVDEIAMNKVWNEALQILPESGEQIKIFHPSQSGFNFPAQMMARSDLFLQHIKATPPDIRRLDFFGYSFVMPDTILEGLAQFSQLESLGLRQPLWWKPNCVEKLANICGDKLIHLEIKLHAEALPSLMRFKNLQTLYLDLSDNYTLTDLSDLKAMGQAVTVLDLSNCVYLRDLSGLQYCTRLTEVCFYNVTLENFEALIDQLCRLPSLRLMVLERCHFPGLTAEQLRIAVEKIKRQQPDLFISANLQRTEALRVRENDLLFDDLNTQRERTPQHQPNPVPPQLFLNPKLRCQSYTANPDSQHTYQQFFSLSSGQWPDPRMDRHQVLTHFEENAQGAFVLASPSLTDYSLRPIGEVKVIPFREIHSGLLQQAEAKIKKPCYFGQFALGVSQDWTRVPSRGVFPQPFACSISLEWAHSIQTGELFVRLPASSTLTPGKPLIRYAAQLDASRPRHQRKIEVSELPALMKRALIQLNKQPWRERLFPRWTDFCLAMTKVKVSDLQARYTLIKKYCQIGSEGGFKAEACDAKITTQIQAFVNSLQIPNAVTVVSLVALLDTLLQQRGACAQAAQTAKYLADYYQLPSHILKSTEHIFYDHPDGRGGIMEVDFGGGERRLSFSPWPKENLEPLSSLAQKKQWMEAIEREFKPVFPRGHASPNAQKYWQEIMSARHPTIYCDDPQKDMEPLRASLIGDFILHDLRYSKRRLMDIEHPSLLQDWLKAAHFKEDKAEEKDGPLGRFLRNTQRSILLVHLFAFQEQDRMEVQSMRDVHRLFKDSPLPPELDVLFVVPSTMLNEDNIFFSRSDFFEGRPDLWNEANRELSRWQWDLPTDRAAIADLKTTHLYNDPLRIDTALIGAPVLQGKNIRFVASGAFPTAIARRAPGMILTDVPDSVPLLRQAIWNEQVDINAMPVDLPPGFKIYKTCHPPLELKNIDFITTLPKDGRRLFCLNRGNYSFLVSGTQRIDGGLVSIKPILLEENPPVIAITANLSYADLCLLADDSRQQPKRLSVYVCPGRTIGIQQPLPVGTDPAPEWKPSKQSSGIIESDQPEQVLAEYQYSNADVLTLTPQVEIDLLMYGQGRDWESYRAGWLLKRLRTPGCTTVLIGEMSQTLYEYLELLFVNGDLCFNGQRETMPGILIWIKPTQSAIQLPSLVNRYSHPPLPDVLSSCGTKRKREADDKSELEQPAPPQTIRDFLLQDKQPVLLLTGPAASGKTHRIKNAIQSLPKGIKTQYFTALEDYVAWRTDHRHDHETMPIVHWAHCNLQPSGCLELMRDSLRTGQFYWQGHWYPAPKIILTTLPLTEAQKKQHPLLFDDAIPKLHCSELTRDELKTQILLPLLANIKELKQDSAAAVDIIFKAYDYLKQQLPFVLITPRDLISLCQRLAVLLSESVQQNKAGAICRSIYEEFFGLFPEKNSREKFSQMLRAHGPDFQIIPSDLDILKKTGEKFRSGKLESTKQHCMIATIIQRMLQVREKFGEHPPGKYGLVLQGSSGLLKTEATILTLEALGFTPAPDIGQPGRADQRHYLNITTCHPSILEKRIQQCVDNGWVLVWNEANFLTPDIENRLIKAIKTAQKPPQSRFRLIITLNPARAGSTPLSLRLRSYLQIIDVHDYTQQELIDAAKNQGLSRHAELIAQLFMRLQSLQDEKEWAVANPRHYFRLLDALPKTPELQPAHIVECLIKIGCTPIPSPDSQAAVVRYLLEGVRNIPFSTVDTGLTTAGTFASTSAPARMIAPLSRPRTSGGVVNPR